MAAMWLTLVSPVDASQLNLVVQASPAGTSKRVMKRQDLRQARSFRTIVDVTEKLSAENEAER